jgi:hypothetical protein
MMEKICGLCARTTPVFFYKNEEQVKRLPERSLTPLLQELKEDMKHKANYLKYLKVSTRFIEACHCAEPVHAYCLSAQVTRSKKIYCPTCKEPYRYFIKEEKICDTKLLKLVAIYFLVFVLILLGLAGIMIFDGYLKFQKDLNKHPPAYTTFWDAVRWNLLAPMSVVICLFLIWCFYLTY